ncbi:ABC-type nitrate/sulfonate/taurine/bicarbonate transport systems, periplasmic component [Desulforamulus hydrothermalis Lam5 = DSM 18033]|uniref:ABC-type nitrate/sulfonate/taurine/bicarbonate transport systems, periplasmic component n=1 Tax=Desulforamulus hydrothermalis Lam5 = DSM 18033 TaxID=1121428 RepID=K8E838_9FIRM|nr:ABC-type nitrate/sulfonate/taurine/bicarbonate transport systems, periplasmic component [Desulforamulus hydrothermalis Lam5 = DSM 18033]SHH24952.1 NitT/TauT family transport system substrate-binding protein [Desulforamulus hydrothermalis Lam5 = DSM 18033]
MPHKHNKKAFAGKGLVFLKKYGRWLVLALLLALMAGLGAHGVKTYLLYSKEPAQPAVIKVGELERSLLGLPHYVALAQGFYREQNLQVTSFVLDKSTQADLQLSNRADVYLGNLCQAVFTRPLGTGAELVALAGLARLEGSFLLGRQINQPFTWNSLKKKSILGDAPDSQANIVLEEALRQNKLALQHQVIIIQNLPPDLKEGAFEAGVGHFVQLPEPQATFTEQKGFGQKAVFLGGAVNPIPSLALLAPPAYPAEHSRQCQQLVNGLCKGLLWLDYHSAAEAAKAVARYFPELDHQTLTGIIDQYKKLGLWGKSPLIGQPEYESLQLYVKKAGELSNPVSYQDGVYAKFAKKAAKTVEYVPPSRQQEKTWWEKLKTLDFK